MTAELDRLLGDIARFEAIVATWGEDARDTVASYRRAIEALHGEALRRLGRALKVDPGALEAVREAAADPVVYAVLRRHDIVKPSLGERAEAALDGIRPMLAEHGGDVMLVAIAPPRVEIRFNGACNGCAASSLTFHAAVKRALHAACPELTEIVQLPGSGGGAPQGPTGSPVETSGWLRAGTAAEIPDGGLRILDVCGRDVVLFRSGDGVSCFDNACSHFGVPIDGGMIADGILACPDHGFRFDLATGACLTDPELPLRAHGVRLVGGRVEIRLAS